MQVEYLEIVTTDTDATCLALGKQHGIAFSDPVPELGNARLADFSNGGRISVRAPMAEHESAVVRPYLLVDDIETAIADAQSAGAEFAMLATNVPGQGTFAIYMLGGIQHGIWQR
ncbi:MAG: hydroxylase [Pseudomonadota bacterium]